MNFEVEITKWWAALTKEPTPGTRVDHPAYDGRELVIEGKATVGDVYYSPEDRRFDGAMCRMYLRPVDEDKEPLQETARWFQEPDGWRIYLDLNLPRSQWEDLWRRTCHDLPKIRVWVGMEAVDGLPDEAKGIAWLSRIEISN